MKPPSVTLKQWVKRGDLLGYCGSTGNSSGPHCHYDVPLFDVISSPRSYVYGNSYASVKKNYADPKPFVSETIPMARELPYVGYHYLQGVRDGIHGVYFHSGEDLNGLNDLGKPVYAPVEGRVVYVGTDDVGAMKAPAGSQRRKSLERALNGGWGYFVIIEEKPGYVISK